MPQELDPQLLEAVWSIVKLLGGVSVLGLIGTLIAYHTLLPDLSIEEIKNKGKYNFESRIIVRNIGKLPAFDLTAEAHNMNFVIGTNTFENNTLIGVSAKKLAANEKMEFPVCPNVQVPAGTNLNSCDYKLIIKYRFQLPFYKSVLSKQWKIELRNAVDEFTWQFTSL